ncbi:MAG: hypothetical protein ACXU8S_01200 [Phenylobacterium sp.]
MLQGGLCSAVHPCDAGRCRQLIETLKSCSSGLAGPIMPREAPGEHDVDI